MKYPRNGIPVGGAEQGHVVLTAVSFGVLSISQLPKYVTGPSEHYVARFVAMIPTLMCIYPRDDSICAIDPPRCRLVQPPWCLCFEKVGLPQW